MVRRYTLHELRCVCRSHNSLLCVCACVQVRAEETKCRERVYRLTQRLRKVAADFEGEFADSKSRFGYGFFYTVPTKANVQVVLGGWMSRG